MNILYICTHNRCRSILSEAITRKHIGNTITVQSAGSQPAKEVHPLSLKYLAEMGYNTANLNSKSWNDLGEFKPDVVITVCDQAAGEACPVWLGSTPKIHWGLKDPSAIVKYAEEAEVAQAFKNTISQIEERVIKLKKIIDLPKEEQLTALRNLATT